MTAAAPWPGAAPSETTIMRAILIALSRAYHPRGLWWRRNVGMAQTATGSVVRFGLAGQADLCGLIDGRHVEIEVKRPGAGASRGGRQTRAQQNWQRAVERAGGIYILATSPDDALTQLSDALGGAP